MTTTALIHSHIPSRVIEAQADGLITLGCGWHHGIVDKDAKKQKEPDRAARLSEALRSNLRRRKQQARDRDRDLESRDRASENVSGPPDKKPEQA